MEYNKKVLETLHVNVHGQFLNVPHQAELLFDYDHLGKGMTCTCTLQDKTCPRSHLSLNFEIRQKNGHQKQTALTAAHFHTLGYRTLGPSQAFVTTGPLFKRAAHQC